MFLPWLKTGEKSVNVQRYFVINREKSILKDFVKCIVFEKKMVAHLQHFVFTDPFLFAFYTNFK